MKSSRAVGILFVFLSAVIFGFTPVLAGISYQGGNNGVNMAFLRALLPLPILLVMGSMQARGKKPTCAQLRTGALLGCMQFGCTILLYSAYSFISVGVATTLHFLYPLLVVCWRVLADRKRPGALKLAGLGLGLAGVVCLLERGEGALDPTGVALALLSSVFFAAYMLFLQKENRQPMPLYQLTSIISATGVVVCGAAGLGLGKLTLMLTPEAWGYAAACALLVTIGGSTLLQAGVRRVGDADASIYSLLEPLTSILFGMMLLGEDFSLRKGISCLLILAGLLVTALCDRQESRKGEQV